MTALVNDLKSIADRFDVAVLDQYGVLHDGIAPYPSANHALGFLREAGKEIVILSNSGRRAYPNLLRIRGLGLGVDELTLVVTSGEVCWQDFDNCELALAPGGKQRVFPIEGCVGDAIDWAAQNRGVDTVTEFGQANAILLMGMPDGERLDRIPELFERALQQGLPLICTNPDKRSPGKDQLLASPGTLADCYAEQGGEVVWYGKPYPKIYNAVSARFPDIDPRRILMIGDSLEHDIAGADGVGWSTALVRGGIHKFEFARCSSQKEILMSLSALAVRYGGVTPDYSLELLS